MPLLYTCPHGAGVEVAVDIQKFAAMLDIVAVEMKEMAEAIRKDGPIFDFSGTSYTLVAQAAVWNLMRNENE